MPRKTLLTPGEMIAMSTQYRDSDVLERTRELESQYIKYNAPLLEGFRQQINIPDIENLGRLLFVLDDDDGEGKKSLAFIEDAEGFAGRDVKMLKHFKKTKEMIALLGYPEVFKDLGFDYKKYVLYLNDLMVETDEYFAEKKANRPQRYTDNYIIDKRLAPVYMEMEEAGASPTEQDRFIIEVFSHFKYLGYEGNQTESDKLNSVRKYRERSLANHTVK